MGARCIAEGQIRRTDLDSTLCLLIADIAATRAQYSLELEISLGKRIVEYLFNGRLQVWQRRGRGDSRYKALSRHPELRRRLRRDPFLTRRVIRSRGGYSGDFRGGTEIHPVGSSVDPDRR